MNRVQIRLSLVLITIVAFCTSASGSTLDRISDPELNNYASREIARGAPALEVPSRILYREALSLIDQGDRKAAREKLLLAANLSERYPDPLFTLARIELLQADPDFLLHLTTGFSRLSRSFYHQSLLAANAALFLVAGTFGTLLIVLIVLTIKQWSLIDHWLRERYARLFDVAPAKWTGFLVLAALVFMRLGAALYIVILLPVVWSCVGKGARALVLGLAILVATTSFFARYANVLVPAIDPGSATHRLSLINERGADEQLRDGIEGLNDPAFRAEKEYALGVCLYRLGDYGAARRHLLDAVSRNDAFAPAYLSLGNVYFMEGEYDKALAGYQNVVALDSTNAPAHYNIGQAYIKKMLFSKSSAALERANKLGIERYRAENLSTRLSNGAVYEEGFSNVALWSLAFREGTARKGSYIGEVLRPVMLFPFEYLWILLAVCAVAAIVVGRKTPRSWDVFRCENCGSATCESCADSETGLKLCSHCARVISGLSSVKVMEALLRHRRQKMWIRANRRAVTWRSMFWPGTAFVYHGRLTGGATLIFVNLVAFIALLCGGFYFNDFRTLTEPNPLWKVIGPLAVLAAGYLISLRARSPQEPRNYRILPPEMWTETREQETAVEEPAPAAPPVAEQQPDEESPLVEMGSFIDL